MTEKPYKDDRFYLFAAMGDAAWSRIVLGSELEKCVVEAILGDKPEGELERPLDHDVVEGTLADLGDPECWGGMEGVDTWGVGFEDGHLEVTSISEDLLGLDGTLAEVARLRGELEGLTKIPLEEFRGARALVLYFPTDANRQEFMDLWKAEHPGGRAIPIEAFVDGKAPLEGGFGRCEIKWCKSGQPATIDVHENIGDGCWRVRICQQCADDIRVSAGDDLPEAIVVEGRVLEARRTAVQGGGANG